MRLAPSAVALIAQNTLAESASNAWASRGSTDPYHAQLWIPFSKWHSCGGRAEDFPTPIVDASPTLAPFQRVRFCLRYPSNGKSNPTEVERLISTLRPRTDVHQSQRQRVYCSDTQKL